MPKDAVEVIKRATLAGYERARVHEDCCAREFLRAAAALGAAHRATIRLEPRPSAAAPAPSWRDLLAVVSETAADEAASPLVVLSPARGYLAIHAGRARRSLPPKLSRASGGR